MPRFNEPGIVIALVVALLGFTPAWSATEDVRAQLIEVNQRLDKVLGEGDGDALKNMITDDVVYIHAGAGVRDTRESWLKVIHKSKGLYVSRKTENLDVKVYGETALVACDLMVHYNLEYLAKAPDSYKLPEHYQNHQLRVYRKVNGAWKLAYMHVTFGIDTAAQEYDVMRYIDRIKKEAAKKS